MFGFESDIEQDPLIAEVSTLKPALFFGDLHQTYDLIFSQFVHPSLCKFDMFGHAEPHSPLHYDILFIDRYRPPEPPQEFWAWDYAAKLFSFTKKIACTADINDGPMRGRLVVENNPFQGVSWFQEKNYSISPLEVIVDLPNIPNKTFWLSYFSVRSTILPLPFCHNTCKILDRKVITHKLNGKSIKIDLLNLAVGSLVCSHPELLPLQADQHKWVWFFNFDAICEEWESWIAEKASYWNQVTINCFNEVKNSWILADTENQELPRNKVTLDWEILKDSFSTIEIPQYLRPAAIRYATQDFWNSGQLQPFPDEGDIYFKISSGKLQYFITEPRQMPSTWNAPRYEQIQYPYLEPYAVYYPFGIWKSPTSAPFYPSSFYAQARNSKLEFTNVDVNLAITVEKNNEEEELLIKILNTISATKAAIDALQEEYEKIQDLSNSILDFLED